MTNNSIRIEADALTDIGGKEEQNEDAIFVCHQASIAPAQLVERGHLYAVADGVSSVRGGKEASQLAVQLVAQYYYNDTDPDLGESLRWAINQAHREICRRAQEAPHLDRMATTFVGAVVHASRLYVAHVGDSRAYLIQDNNATQLTTDHTFNDPGHKEHGALTRWLGNMAQPDDIEVDLNEYPLEEGDVVVLCSDGLYKPIERYRRQQSFIQLTSRYPAKRAVQRLLELAKQLRTRDNVSVVVARHGGEIPFTLDLPWRSMMVGASLIALLLLAVGLIYLFIPTRSDIFPGSSQNRLVFSASANTTLSPSPSPTPTSPPPTATAAPTEKAEPTALPPTSTLVPPSPTPSPTIPLPSPTPTQMSILTSTQIILLTPADKHSFPVGTNQITFSWKWGDNCGMYDDLLKANGAFDVRCKPRDDSGPLLGIKDVKTIQDEITCKDDGIYSLEVNNLTSAPGLKEKKSGEFIWNVYLVQIDPYEDKGLADILPARIFTIAGHDASKTGGGGGGDDVGRQD